MTVSILPLDQKCHLQNDLCGFRCPVPRNPGALMPEVIRNMMSEEMKKAVEEVKNGESCKRSAERHDINRTTLLNHVKGIKCKNVGRPTVLTHQEEELLVHSLQKLHLKVCCLESTLTLSDNEIWISFLLRFMEKKASYVVPVRADVSDAESVSDDEDVEDAFATYKTYTDNKQTIHDLKLRTTNTPHPTNRTIKTTQDIQTPDTEVLQSTTIGIFIKNMQNQIRLNKKLITTDNINAVEARALATSIKHIKHNIRDYANRNIIFYTDSASVLAQLENGACRNKIINCAKKDLENIKIFNINYNIIKINRCNQNHIIAHNLAKEAHTNPQEVITITTKQDIDKLKKETKIILWQQNWDRDAKGRKTDNIMPTVRLAEPVYTWKAVQLLTGHGHMQDYYRRFNLRDTNGNCDQCNVPEDQHHIINTCMLSQRITARQTLTQKLRQKQRTYPPTNVDITDKTLTTWINEWAENMILDDDAQDT
ncbi:unnamed protein product [Diabrotica balteata]|uniref:HTH psq-type domain-containing protein n=1 Tax=Diabrotica balteata TaxID=107213 RepID=A0A9P0E1Z3_DIABA|nr:unnamed protein product [Diabrotica balteata]